MKELKTEFECIRPQLLEEDESVGAWFTLKNADYVSAGQSIAGLNLGFNTPESKEVIAQNRLALLQSLNIDSEWTAYADQVHSNRIQVVSEGGTYPSTDGLVTKIPGLTLAIQVADCAAVLLWDSSNNVIAALHAGWRGAAGNIVPRGIEEVVRQGGETKHLKAFVSPCISQTNFEVGIEVAEQFPDRFVDATNFEKPHIDLKAFIKDQLTSAGISKHKIEIRPECTIDDAGKFYSFRREGKNSGRMMALISIQK
ncbi:peptidoglycan editing factor PgeF [Fodinibius sp. Rm-B-1B1-1]|uniref:peptidoglycan editing factor PgeF n=1 Tax=Fodinibius alkaliphilus TaxID=3140241 RepID=UPI00315A8208